MIGEQPTGGVTNVGSASGVVTVVEGRTFCLSSAAGDITADLAHGHLVLDTRALSRWKPRVNGAPVELAASTLGGIGTGLDNRLGRAC